MQENAIIPETNWTSNNEVVQLTVAPEPPPVVDKPLLYNVPMPDDLQVYLYEACEQNGVPFEFALALIGNESGYQADAISETNDYGLMQINQCNHEWLSEELGIDDFMNPEENIQAGTYILSGLFEKYEDPHKVLMAYNMGEGGAKKQWDSGVFQSNYSRRVMGKLDELKQKEDTHG